MMLSAGVRRAAGKHIVGKKLSALLNILFK
jgi:hypothetical protein